MQCKVKRLAEPRNAKRSCNPCQKDAARKCSSCGDAKGRRSILLPKSRKHSETNNVTINEDSFVPAAPAAPAAEYTNKRPQVELQRTRQSNNSGQNSAYQKTIVSGSHDGQLVIWDLRFSDDGGIQVIPRNLIFAHSAKVTALTRAPYGLDNQSNVISAAENGELCLWDTDDGICIETNLIPGMHLDLLSFHVSTGTRKEWRVVCYGSYADMFVLSALSLEVLYILHSPTTTNWISAACVVRPARKREDVVVAVLLSGSLCIWTLKSAVDAKYAEPTYQHPQALKPIVDGKASSICCNPFTQRSIFVVSAKCWMLLDSGDFTSLAEVKSPAGQSWQGGDFVSADSVLVSSRDGKSYVYRLPPSCCPGFQENAVANTLTEPTVIQTFDSTTNQAGSSDCEAAVHFSYGRRGPFYKLLLRGASSGNIDIWKIDTNLSSSPDIQSGSLGTPPFASCSIANCWESSCLPCGLIDFLDYEGEAVPVSCSLYLASQGRVVCGREDGSIVCISAAQAAIAQLLKGKGWPSHRLLLGHKGRVTCLLYPYDEDTRYEKEQLVSGGVDFTVKLWNISSGDLLHTFSHHGGEILRLMCTPVECSSRVNSCICSVAQDNSVALLGLRERKCVLLASTHAFPVETIKWRALDDFIVVACSDGSVYVWQMETGHLDRCVSGQVAIDILTACDEERSPSSIGVPSKAKQSLRGKLSSFTAHLPPQAAQVASATVKRLKRTAGYQSTSGNTRSSPRLSGEDYKELSSSSYPLKIISTTANTKDPEIHVLLLDVEELICQLLTEENPHLAELGKKKSSEVTKTLETGKRSRRSSRKAAGPTSATIPPSEPKLTRTRSKPSMSETHDIAQLMMSTLHSWDLDPDIDAISVERLGLIKPIKPVSFGILTRGGRLSLMLPGWYGETKESLTETPPETLMFEEALGKQPGLIVNSNCYQSRWQLSSALTTLHLVSLVSLANTLMCMNQFSFISEEKRLALLTNASLNTPVASPPADNGEQADQEKSGADSWENTQLAMNHRAHIKAGWSHVAALHCCLLADLLSGSSYKPPLLHTLARKWQDRCLEVREAAQAILLAELRRIGVEGRKRVVQTWAPELLRKLNDSSRTKQEKEGLSAPPLIDLDRREEDDVIFPSDDVSPVLTSAKKLLQYDMRRRKATAIVLLGVIGAEFQTEVELYTRRGQEKAGSFQPNTFSRSQSRELIMDNTTVRNAGKELMYLLLKPPSSPNTAHTSVRRAAIDLIGRGFTLWEPYMDVSAVLLALLELSADAKKRDHTFKKGLPLSPAADTHRSSRHALSLIATSRPTVFIATIAKEVARSVAAASSISFNQPSPAAIAVYSHVRHQPAQNAELQSTSVLNRAKGEILRILELMVEKNQQEIVELLTDVVDVVVYCLDQRQVKEKGLAELFPGLYRFNMVSYSHQSRRLAVGAKSGQVALYDLRSSRCQMISAYQSPVTALSFSPDDRTLVTYSYGSSKICFWQTGSSLFGMVGGSSMKCVRFCTTVSSSPKLSPALLKLIRLIWINNRTVILLMADGTEYQYSV